VSYRAFKTLEQAIAALDLIIKARSLHYFLAAKISKDSAVMLESP
jgi:hypothetical protein